MMPDPVEESSGLVFDANEQFGTPDIAAGHEGSDGYGRRPVD
jgi:hypothetical protein